MFVTSVPFERLHDDEVQYFLESQQIITSGPLVHGNLIFIPQALAGVGLLLFDSIFTARCVSALAVLGTALAIFYLKRDTSSFIGAMLFLTSFYTLRFGMRFYLDPFGGLFTALTVLFLKKNYASSAGVSAALGAFSRQLVVPLVPVYLYSVYHERIGLRKFLAGLLAVAVLSSLWIYLATGIKSSAATGITEIAAIPSSDLSAPTEIVYGFAEFFGLGFLTWLGFILAPNKRKSNEWLPLLFSIIVLILTPGFVTNGGATEYPYVTSVLLSMSAGAGLQRAYAKFRPNMQYILIATVIALLAQYSAQSYLATTLSPNHAIGVQDYGYNYDQELLSYLALHYDGGQIYGSNRDGMLLPQVSPNWVWIPQNVTKALDDNPPWLVTYTSYVVVESVPANATVVTIGPYLVIHTTSTPLSGFVHVVSQTGRFVP